MYFTSYQNIPVIDKDFLLFGEIATFRLKRISGNSEVRFCEFFVFRGEKVVCKIYIRSTDSKLLGEFSVFFAKKCQESLRFNLAITAQTGNIYRNAEHKSIKHNYYHLKLFYLNLLL